MNGKIVDADIDAVKPMIGRQTNQKIEFDAKTMAEPQRIQKIEIKILKHEQILKTGVMCPVCQRKSATIMEKQSRAQDEATGLILYVQIVGSECKYLIRLRWLASLANSGVRCDRKNCFEEIPFSKEFLKIY